MMAKCGKNKQSGTQMRVSASLMWCWGRGGGITPKIESCGTDGDLSQINDQHTGDYLNCKETCKCEKNFQGQFGVFFPA